MGAKPKVLSRNMLMVAISMIAAATMAVDGVYPHLAMSNDEGECGTGALVPWAGSLWAVTYGPHCPIDKVDFREVQGGDFRKACRLVADGVEPNAKGEIEIEWSPDEKTHPSVPLANAIEVLPL